MKIRYLFTVSYTCNGVELDTFYQLRTSALNLDPVAFKVALKIDPNLCSEDFTALHAIIFRQRYAMTEGPYQVTVDDDPLDRQTLECVLNNKMKDGTLNKWLASAKIWKPNE